jgi:hypothetical protein
VRSTIADVYLSSDGSEVFREQETMASKGPNLVFDPPNPKPADELPAALVDLREPFLVPRTPSNRPLRAWLQEDDLPHLGYRTHPLQPGQALVGWVCHGPGGYVQQSRRAQRADAHHDQGVQHLLRVRRSHPACGDGIVQRSGPLTLRCGLQQSAVSAQFASPRQVIEECQ